MKTFTIELLREAQRICADGRTIGEAAALLGVNVGSLKARASAQGIRLCARRAIRQRVKRPPRPPVREIEKRAPLLAGDPLLRRLQAGLR